MLRKWHSCACHRAYWSDWTLVYHLHSVEMDPHTFYSKRIVHHRFLRDAVETLEDESIKTADIVITGKIYYYTDSWMQYIHWMHTCKNINTHSPMTVYTGVCVYIFTCMHSACWLYSRIWLLESVTFHILCNLDFFAYIF